MQVVANFNKHLNGARITWNPYHPTTPDLYIDTLSDGDGKFFLSSDMNYNTSQHCVHLRYVFFVSVIWEENKMTIGLAPKGQGTHTYESWSAPINRDVMKTPGAFLNYLTLCVQQKEIMKAYFNN